MDYEMINKYEKKISLAALKRRKYKPIIDKKSNIVLLLLKGKAGIGFCWVNLLNTAREKKAIIEDIYVKPEFRSKKLGKTMLTKALSILKRKGIYLVFASTVVDNKEAIEFYKKNGFIELNQKVLLLKIPKISAKV
jgi:ribosomal protein S18 acetylase RimI-like enzyme